jgi:hypothetical protein
MVAFAPNDRLHKPIHHFLHVDIIIYLIIFTVMSTDENSWAISIKQVLLLEMNNS